MANTNESFMRRAIELSRKGMLAGDGGPFGCVIVKDGQIIGEGWNRVIVARDPTAHGEVTAIREACQRLGTHDLAGCELYTSAEPCPMCLAAIYWARLDRYFYGNNYADTAAIGFDDSFFHEEMIKPTEQRTIPAVRLLPQEALAVFQEFFANPNRVKY